MVYMLHYVKKSPWPMQLGLGMMMLGLSLGYYLSTSDASLMLGSFIFFLFSFLNWVQDIFFEVQAGEHPIVCMDFFKLSFSYFIFTELMVFFSFFWCFFHYSLSPPMEVGFMWPPLMVFLGEGSYGIPLMNSLILLTSGFFSTLAHHRFLGDETPMFFLSLTLVFGLVFTVTQYMEYMYSPYSMSDSVWGSVFFLGVGLHGAHVFIGSLMFSFLILSSLKMNFSSHNKIMFEGVVWYWHFVDVIWLLLYSVFYVWGM